MAGEVGCILLPSAFQGVRRRKELLELRGQSCVGLQSADTSRWVGLGVWRAWAAHRGVGADLGHRQPHWMDGRLFEGTASHVLPRIFCTWRNLHLSAPIILRLPTNHAQQMQMGLRDLKFFLKAYGLHIKLSRTYIPLIFILNTWGQVSIW